MCTLDKATLEMIIETRNNVQHIKERLDTNNLQYEKVEARVRRLELLFIPAILVMTYLSNKIIEVI